MRQLTDIARAGLVVVALALLAPAGAQARELADAEASEAALWQGLKSGGHVVMLRHARAPGTGDPDDFELGDCTTQRNLSAQGRDQARRLGDLFRANGIDSARVFSSQWCRCYDTALLMNLGPVTAHDTLNSFFGGFYTRARQSAGVRRLLAGLDLGTPTVLVTHQVNITAFSDTFMSEGSLLFFRVAADGDVTLIGSIDAR